MQKRKKFPLPGQEDEAVLTVKSSQRYLKFDLSSEILYGALQGGLGRRKRVDFQVSSLIPR
ncbi:hypothetical protein HAT2_00432 [Candidatus Similichlamydia laticola]|uniref:Uncharacterized protein n=1 Tax=Candidatus Similichlamydia laticola TaxID=2170265 RepID=A0A369KI44_9BACT|nr:hypothetical protein HAT2_00432 [Candidatus Similichlamydia laticola]